MCKKKYWKTTNLCGEKVKEFYDDASLVVAVYKWQDTPFAYSLESEDACEVILTANKGEKDYRMLKYLYNKDVAFSRVSGLYGCIGYIDKKSGIFVEVARAKNLI